MASEEEFDKDGRMKEEFDKLDKDGSGKISCKDLESVISKGLDMTAKGKKDQASKIAKELIKDCDKDADGEISFEEFKSGFPSAMKNAALKHGGASGLGGLAKIFPCLGSKTK